MWIIVNLKKKFTEFRSWVSQGLGAKPESEIGSNFFIPTLENPEMLDLSVKDDAVVRPLHHSILGKEHCFEVCQ